MRNKSRGSRLASFRLGVGCPAPTGSTLNIAGGGNDQRLPVRRIRAIVSMVHVDAGAIPGAGAAADGPLHFAIRSITGSAFNYTCLYAQTDGTFDEVADATNLSAEAIDVTAEVDD